MFPLYTLLSPFYPGGLSHDPGQDLGVEAERKEAFQELFRRWRLPWWERLQKWAGTKQFFLIIMTYIYIYTEIDNDNTIYIWLYMYILFEYLLGILIKWFWMCLKIRYTRAPIPCWLYGCTAILNHSNGFPDDAPTCPRLWWGWVKIAGWWPVYRLFAWWFYIAMLNYQRDP